MNKIRTLIVGLGRIGKIHLTNLLARDEVQVIGVCDPTNDAKVISNKMGLTFYQKKTNYIVCFANGRTRQFKNKTSRCLLTEITINPDNGKSEAQYSSQSFEQVNYGTQPDEMVQSFED